MKKYKCSGIADGFCALIYMLTLVIRQVVVVFTGKDIFDWKDNNWKDDLLKTYPTDEEIFDIARRICPVCGVNATGEADEIGYHTVFEERAFECQKCKTLFLGSAEGTILRDQDKENIVSIQ